MIKRPSPYGKKVVFLQKRGHLLYVRCQIKVHNWDLN